MINLLYVALGVDAGDVGIDVHDEHRAALAGEDVQVIDEQLTVLGRQRSVEMVRHGWSLLFSVALRGNLGKERRANPRAWIAAPFARYFINTFILVTLILGCQLVLCTLAAYAFARYDFIGSNVAFALVLVHLLRLSR